MKSQNGENQPLQKRISLHLLYAFIKLNTAIGAFPPKLEIAFCNSGESALIIIPKMGKN